MMMKRFLLLWIVIFGFCTMGASQTYIYQGDKRYDYGSKVLFTIDEHLPKALMIYLVM